MKPVLCIRNDRADNFGITPRALAVNGREMVRLDAFDSQARWPTLDEVSALIVFGGEMNVDEVDAHPYLLRERELMLRAIATGYPVLGICLGAQLLARALGARVYLAPLRELGFTPVRLTAAGEADPVLSALDGSPCVFQWHEDTFELPAGSDLLATGKRIANQAFRYAPRAWGVQFHVEVDRDGIEAWLSASDASLKPVWGKTAAEVREEVSRHLDEQQRRSRELFAAFCRQAAD